MTKISSTKAAILAVGIITAASPAVAETTNDDAKIVAALDTEFQAAVKNNDAATVARIQADDMILVLGVGRTATKQDHVNNALNKVRIYEQQDAVPGTQTVRVWGDTAVVTELLWLKFTTKDGKAFDFKLWFSDTYVRTAAL